MDLKFAKWQVCVSLTARRSAACVMNCVLTWLRVQGGKQGESKSLEAANQQAMTGQAQQ
jgi:hypothetical protein